MSKGRKIRCYDYVNHPYEQVRDALSKDALAVFQSATKAAASRARSIASALRVDIGGIGVEADIRISVQNIEEKAPEAMPAPVTRLQLEWEAARMPRLFPLMKAELFIYPLTATETQLDFVGVYEPPRRQVPHRAKDHGSAAPRADQGSPAPEGSRHQGLRRQAGEAGL
jgi:hypothetical protein